MIDPKTLWPFKLPSQAGIKIDLPAEVKALAGHMLDQVYWTGALAGATLVAVVLVVIYLLSCRRDGARIAGITAALGALLWYAGHRCDNAVTPVPALPHSPSPVRPDPKPKRPKRPSMPEPIPEPEPDCPT